MKGLLAKLPPILKTLTFWKASVELPCTSASSSDVFCNCLPTILCTLSELGCRSFFCRNSSEISTALEAGLDTSELIFAPPMIVGSQLKLATKLGVTKVAFQTEADLARIKQIAPNAE